MIKLTVPQMLALLSQPLEGMSDDFQAAIATLLVNYRAELEKQELVESVTGWTGTNPQFNSRNGF